MKGRVAVVTGGASGIGLACARALAAIGGRAYAVDVGAASTLEPLAARIEQDLGPVHMLVNAAGIIQGAMLAPQDIPAETAERVFRVNLLGTQAACAAFGSRMAGRRQGAILNIGSIAGMRSTPLHAYGPMGLGELCSTKWVAEGDGQVRS